MYYRIRVAQQYAQNFLEYCYIPEATTVLTKKMKFQNTKKKHRQIKVVTQTLARCKTFIYKNIYIYTFTEIVLDLLMKTRESSNMKTPLR